MKNYEMLLRTKYPGNKFKRMEFLHLFFFLSPCRKFSVLRYSQGVEKNKSSDKNFAISRGDTCQFAHLLHAGLSCETHKAKWTTRLQQKRKHDLSLLDTYFLFRVPILLRQNYYHEFCEWRLFCSRLLSTSDEMWISCKCCFLMQDMRCRLGQFSYIRVANLCVLNSQ